MNIEFTIKEIEALSCIKTVEELPSEAVYYSDEHYKRGSYFRSWTRLYDAKFNTIKDCYVSSTNILRRLKRIAKKDNDNFALQAYDMVDLGNGYNLVNKNDDTGKALKAIASSLI